MRRKRASSFFNLQKRHWRRKKKRNVCTAFLSQQRVSRFAKSIYAPRVEGDKDKKPNSSGEQFDFLQMTVCITAGSRHKKRKQKVPEKTFRIHKQTWLIPCDTPVKVLIQPGPAELKAKWTCSCDRKLSPSHPRGFISWIWDWSRSQLEAASSSSSLDRHLERPAQLGWSSVTQSKLQRPESTLILYFKRHLVLSAASSSCFSTLEFFGCLQYLYNRYWYWRHPSEIYVIGAGRAWWRRRYG